MKMDFGTILDKWEKQKAANRVGDNSVSDNGVSEDTGARAKSNERRSRLLRKKPDAFIDLHGLNRDEAWSSLEAFFETSRNKGFEKVRIIHGKGSHGKTEGNSEGVLRELSRRFIENCSFAGESGFCTAREGGSGATWVILKEKF